MRSVGDATAVGGSHLNHHKGKKGEREIRKEEAVLSTFDVVDGDMANLHNVAETYEAGVANITSNEGQVGVC